MSGQRLIIYDNTENSIKEWFWRRYVQVRRGWKKIGVSSWADAKDKILEAVRPGTRLMELQIWGDGAPGMPGINGKPPPDAFWWLVGTLVTPESLVWFRMCSVFWGRKGDDFAISTAKTLGCRVAGHTHVIGPWQSGLWSYTGKSLPAFAPHEGDWTKLKSGPFQPNTIFCAKMSFPDFW
jgi:hypothetical protein